MGLRVGSGLPNVQKSRLEQVVVSFPSLEEQQQIGSFFQEIDAALAHSERLLAKLQGVKKSFLSKLFVSSSSGAEVWGFVFSRIPGVVVAPLERRIKDA